MAAKAAWPVLGARCAGTCGVGKPWIDWPQVVPCFHSPSVRGVAAGERYGTKGVLAAVRRCLAWPAWATAGLDPCSPAVEGHRTLTIVLRAVVLLNTACCACWRSWGPASSHAVCARRRGAWPSGWGIRAWGDHGALQWEALSAATRVHAVCWRCLAAAPL